MTKQARTIPVIARLRTAEAACRSAVALLAMLGNDDVRLEAETKANVEKVQVAIDRTIRALEQWAAVKRAGEAK